MKASLPAHLMIILGASEGLSSSWAVVENTYKFYTKNKAWGYIVGRGGYTLGAGLDTSNNY